MFSSPDLNPTITAFRQPYTSTRKRTENSVQLLLPSSSYVYILQTKVPHPSAKSTTHAQSHSSASADIQHHNFTHKSWYQNCFTHKLNLPNNTKPGNTRASRAITVTCWGSNCSWAMPLQFILSFTISLFLEPSSNCTHSYSTERGWERGGGEGRGEKAGREG